MIGKKLDINKKWLDKWGYPLLIFVTAVLFFFFMGEWIFQDEDTIVYINEVGHMGVMPIYPQFINFFQLLLGENFLHGVVIAQSLLAIVCIYIFIKVLRRQYNLDNRDTAILFVLSLLPFSIHLPESNITHQILTEGISYSIFYVFFTLVLYAMLTLRYRWYLGSLLVALILGLIRPQMLLLQVVCCLELVWIVCKKNNIKKYRKLGLLFISFGIGLVISFLSYKTIFSISDIYVSGFYKSSVEETVKEDNSEVSEQAAEPEIEKTSVVEKKYTQFDSVLFIRGFFEADYEDAQLFDDEVTRQIFYLTYENACENENLYIHAEPGLYIWRDLVRDKLPRDIHNAIVTFDEQNPGVRIKSEVELSREIAFKILIKHFDRYIYHTIRVMISSFIAAVFFQIDAIYLLCHFITLFIYLIAIGGFVWLIRKGKKEIAYFLLVALGNILIIVGVTNLLFTGMQRYVVYVMGIFWCAMYLMAKEVYNSLRRNK